MTTTIIGPEMTNQNPEVIVKKKSDKDDPAFLKPLEIKLEAYKSEKLMNDPNIS
jgi:hypothetical protein